VRAGKDYFFTAFSRGLTKMLSRLKTASCARPTQARRGGAIAAAPTTSSGRNSEAMIAFECEAERARNASINQLAEHVARKVRGGALVPNIGAHMMQLMYNALDAHATHIAVKICLQSFLLQVRDDGHGMTFEDLRHCGEHGCTSKMQDLSQLRDVSYPTYGYRGESLAAIAEFCHLEILSRSRKRPAETCRKVMGGNSTATPARVLDSTAIGTTVTCRDLFYNRPVARNMIMAQGSKAGATTDSAAGKMQSLLMLVRALAAIHPEVSFTVYEGTHIQPVLSLPKCVGARQAFARISKTVSPHALFHVGLNYGSLRIKALLCPPFLSNLPRTKDAQIIFVNGRLCSRSPLHKRVNAGYKEIWERSTNALTAEHNLGVSMKGLRNPLLRSVHSNIACGLVSLARIVGVNLSELCHGFVS
jgi:DNA mismatch repair protein MutL